MGRLLGADSFWSQGDDLAAASHRPPRPQACKENADAFLFLFSFTDRASFEDLPGQLARVAGEAPGVVRMVIGSKYPPGAPALLRGHVWRGAERGSGGLPVPRGGVRPRGLPRGCTRASRRPGCGGRGTGRRLALTGKPRVSQTGSLTRLQIRPVRAHGRARAGPRGLPAGLATAPAAGEERAGAAAGGRTHAGRPGRAGRRRPRAQRPGGAAVAPGPGGSWPAPRPRGLSRPRGGGLVSGHSPPAGDPEQDLGPALGQKCGFPPRTGHGACQGGWRPGKALSSWSSAQGGGHTALQGSGLRASGCPPASSVAPGAGLLKTEALYAQGPRAQVSPPAPPAASQRVTGERVPQLGPGSQAPSVRSRC